MYHDRAFVRAATTDPRPPSAVSGGAGAAGLAGLVAWLLVARAGGLDGPYSALVGIAVCALAMVGWSLGVDRVYAHASTGIDWSLRRPLAETWRDSAVTLAGLWATWAGIALIYCAGRFYWTGGFGFAMWCLAHAAPVLVLLSVPYVLWIDRRMVERRDDAWHLGAWLLRREGVEARRIHAHLLSWGVKAFFLPFMLGGVPGGFAAFVRGDLVAATTFPAGHDLTQFRHVDHCICHSPAHVEKARFLPVACDLTCLARCRCRKARTCVWRQSVRRFRHCSQG